MYSTKQKEVINNIYFYCKLLCSRTETFIIEHPEAVEILTSYFEATCFRPMKPAQQTSIIITGVSERSIRRFDEQQTFRDSLEPQKHLTGRRHIVLPHWCLELSALLYCISFWFCSTTQNIGIFLENSYNLYIPNSIILNYYNIVIIYMVLVRCPVPTLSKKLSSVIFNNLLILINTFYF